MLGRRWPVLLACPLLAAIVAVGIAGGGSISYTSTTVLVVSAGETKETPGSSVEATMLATTYARLISDDDGLSTYVARQTGLDARHVRDTIDVVQPTNTAILKVSFTEDDEARALAESKAIVAAVESSSTVSQAIPPHVMRVVRVSELSTNYPTSKSTLLGLGVGLGLLLGFGLAFLLERLDLRVDTRRAASALLDCPVREWPTEQTPAALLSLVTRWAELTSQPTGQAEQTGPQSVTIALVPFGRAATKATQRALPALNTAEARRRSTSRNSGAADLVFLGADARPSMLANAPGWSTVRRLWRGRTEARLAKLWGSRPITSVDLVIALLPKGTRVADLTELTNELNDYGRPPVWGLLLPRSGRLANVLETGPAVSANRPAPVTATPVVPSFARPSAPATETATATAKADVTSAVGPKPDSPVGPKADGAAVGLKPDNAAVGPKPDGVGPKPDGAAVGPSAGR
jgi:capsular polysaccharide biosynthesis protein